MRVPHENAEIYALYPCPCTAGCGIDAGTSTMSRRLTVRVLTQLILGLVLLSLEQAAGTTPPPTPPKPRVPLSSESDSEFRTCGIDELKQRTSKLEPARRGPAYWVVGHALRPPCSRCPSSAALPPVMAPRLRSHILSLAARLARKVGGTRPPGLLHKLGRHGRSLIRPY